LFVWSWRFRLVKEWRGREGCNDIVVVQFKKRLAGVAERSARTPSGDTRKHISMGASTHNINLMNRYAARKFLINEISCRPPLPKMAQLAWHPPFHIWGVAAIALHFWPFHPRMTLVISYKEYNLTHIP